VLTNLPVGSYIVMAKAQLDLDSDLTETNVLCTLAAGNVDESSSVRLPTPGSATLPLLVPADLPGGGAVVLTCGGDRVRASNVKITAIQVNSLFVTP
jgi:hypothetical protein